MKKCDHFKDLILTDYMDGELDKNSAKNVESHLLECSDCRAFLKEVKSNAALPFQQTLHQPVPAELWGAIRQRIEDRNQAVNPLADFIEKLKGLIVIPRLVPVFASLILMFLAGSVTFIEAHKHLWKPACIIGVPGIKMLALCALSFCINNKTPNIAAIHFFKYINIFNLRVGYLDLF